MLSLLLLLAQQGALVHALNHYTAYDTQQQSDKPGSHGQSCELCLAFAQVGTSAAPDVRLPGLLTDLAFDQALPVPRESGTSERATPRSRGPPSPL